MLETSDVIAGLRKEIDDLRHGEEAGYVPEVMPTPGQWYRRLHDMDPTRRMAMVTSLVAAAEAGHACAMARHAGELEELRSRAMRLWSTLHGISELCRDSDRDGLVHVGEIVDLLPDGLRYG